MPQDPSLCGGSEPMPGPSCYYSAVCPCCGEIRLWRSHSSQTGDLTKTIVTYEIKCPPELMS